MARVKKRNKTEDVVLTLPTELSEPSNRLLDYVILIYGLEKVGKTALASQFPNTFHAMFEEGARARRIYQRRIKSWSDWLKYLRLLEKDKRFENVSLDTVDLMLDLCQTHVCKRNGVKHPGDRDDFGAVWADLRQEFSNSIQRLSKTGKGIMIISHARERVVKRAESRGGDYDVVCPSMGNQARKVIEPLVDIWGYFSYDGTKRVFQIEGDEFVSAGHRLEDRFLDADTDEPLTTIPMGSSPAAAYVNLMKAFNNELAVKGGGTERAKGKSTVRKKKTRKKRKRR